MHAQRTPQLTRSHFLVAQRLGLIADGLDRIHGVLDRTAIAIGASGELEAVYSAILPRAAPVSFNLAEKTFADNASDFFRGLVSKPTGHDPFDERFVVHAADPARVLSLLDEECRAALFRLAADRRQPLVTAQMVSIRQSLVTGPESIEQALRELVAVAHLLGRAFVTYQGYR